MTRTCKPCSGTGKVWVRPCRYCKGKGYHEQPDPLPSGKELKPRETVAELIGDLFESSGHGVSLSHFGRVELRALMDFLYDEEPQNTFQEVK